jgi:hypothetical protein
MAEGGTWRTGTFHSVQVRVGWGLSTILISSFCYFVKLWRRHQIRILSDSHSTCILYIRFCVSSRRHVIDLNCQTFITFYKIKPLGFCYLIFFELTTLPPRILLQTISILKYDYHLQQSLHVRKTSPKHQMVSGHQFGVMGRVCTGMLTVLGYGPVCR